MDHFHLPPKCIQPQTLHKSIRKETETTPGNRNDRYVLSKQNGNTRLGMQEVGGDRWAGSRGYGNALGILPRGWEIIVSVLSQRMLSETWQSPAQAGSRYSEVSEEKVTQRTAITS